MCLYPYLYHVYCGGPFFLFLPLQATETLMKCRMMRHFIWVFIVCKRRQLVELPTILLRLTGCSRHFSQMRLLCTSHLYPDSRPGNIGTFSFSIFKAKQIAPLSVYIHWCPNPSQRFSDFH